jgi:ABC-type antimicrobial peptide transport system ATPase subunit
LYDDEKDIEVLHNVTMMHTYKIEIDFPAEFTNVKYQNIIEAVEISIDGRQIID